MSQASEPETDEIDDPEFLSHYEYQDGFYVLREKLPVETLDDERISADVRDLLNLPKGEEAPASRR